MNACSFGRLLRLVGKQLDLDAQLDVYRHLDRCAICREAFYQLARELDGAFLIHCAQHGGGSPREYPVGEKAGSSGGCRWSHMFEKPRRYASRLNLRSSHKGKLRQRPLCNYTRRHKFMRDWAHWEGRPRENSSRSFESFESLRLSLFKIYLKDAKDSKNLEAYCRKRYGIREMPDSRAGLMHVRNQL